MTGFVVALALSVLAPAPEEPAARIAVTSHRVTRVLPRDRARTLPVHEGAELTVAARSDAAVRLSSRAWRQPLPFTPRPRGRHTLRFPAFDRLPRRALIHVGDSRYAVRLRGHEHRPIRTYRHRRFLIDWGYAPRSLEELVARSSSVVLARVLAVRQGPPESVGEPGHEIEDVPSQRIVFRTNGRWLGRPAARFELYKTGTQEGWGEGDPPFHRGERHLLFLGARRMDGSILPAAIHGRLRVEGDVLRPFIGGPVARALAWLTPDEARSAVSSVR